MDHQIFPPKVSMIHIVQDHLLQLVVMIINGVFLLSPLTITHRATDGAVVQALINLATVAVWTRPSGSPHGADLCPEDLDGMFLARGSREAPTPGPRELHDDPHCMIVLTRRQSIYQQFSSA